MAECEGTARKITPPEPPSMRDEILALLDLSEIEISMTDTEGNIVTAAVLGRILDTEE